MKRGLAILLFLLLAGLGNGFFQAAQPDLETAWVCPMHADYTMDVAGLCPRCGMALVRSAPFDVRDYDLDFQTIPALVQPGKKATLRFKIMHPGSGQQVKKFEQVHEREYHLFLISQDMQYFQHVHPDRKSTRLNSSHT